MSEVQSPKSKVENKNSTNRKPQTADRVNSGACLWFTGIPCSGKTTIADLVAKELRDMGKRVERLDGDIIRKSLTKDLGFSKKDRDINIERVTFVAKLLSRNSIFVLTSFISPYRAKRNRAREETTNFIEIFVKCSIEECVRRDNKGMYKKAYAGEIKDFTGVSAPYEKPFNPEIILDTERETPRESAQKVIDYLEKEGLIR